MATTVARLILHYICGYVPISSCLCRQQKINQKQGLRTHWSSRELQGEKGQIQRAIGTTVLHTLNTRSGYGYTSWKKQHSSSTGEIIDVLHLFSASAAASDAPPELGSGAFKILQKFSPELLLSKRRVILALYSTTGRGYKEYGNEAIDLTAGNP